MATNEEPGAGAKWTVLSGRVGAEGPFAEKITVPPYEDGKVVTLQIDPSDPNKGNYRTYGLACFRESRKDSPNYVELGTGVYLRELEVGKES